MIANEEQWRVVHGFPRYKVSSEGRVQGPRGLLRPAAGPNGYPTVVLGRGNTRCVHTLVALAFLGPRPEGMDIRHLDGTRTNSRVSNLVYGTRTQNILDVHRWRKITRAEAESIRRRVAAGETQASLAREFGTGASAINAIVKKRAHVK